MMRILTSSLAVLLATSATGCGESDADDGATTLGDVTGSTDGETSGDGDATDGGTSDSSGDGDSGDGDSGDGDSGDGNSGDGDSGDGDGDSGDGDSGDGDGDSGDGDGDSGDGDGDGDSGDGDGDSGDGDGDSGDGDGDGDQVSWLLNSEGGKLYKIDRYTAQATELCDLIDPEGGGSIAFSSLTFARDDRLFGSGADSLYYIELPSCAVTKVGDYGGNITGVNGISPDEGFDLYGVDSTSNNVYRIDPDTAQTTLIGSAGYDIGFGGATWVESEQRLLAVDAGNDTLNEVSTTTGTYTLLGNLSTPLNLVGFEHHPQGGNLYICSSGSAEGLWEVDSAGQMTYIGSIGFACNDLAAPWLEPPLPE